MIEFLWKEASKRDPNISSSSMIPILEASNTTVEEIETAPAREFYYPF
jgi:hypothetical protein